VSQILRKLVTVNVQKYTAPEAGYFKMRYISYFKRVIKHLFQLQYFNGSYPNYLEEKKKINSCSISGI